MSLTAALPAGYLAYMLVMAFLSFSGGPTVIHQALTGLTLAIASLVALMPVGILVFYRGDEVGTKRRSSQVAPAMASMTPAISDIGDDTEALDDFSQTGESLPDSQEGFDLGGFGDAEGEFASGDNSGSDLAFDGIVEEITDTDDELVLSQDALGVSDESLDAGDDDIADFDDLFNDNPKKK